MKSFSNPTTSAPIQLSVVSKIFTPVHRRGIFAAAVLVLLGFSGIGRAASLTLAWDPVTNTPLAGYRVYCGTTSQNYTTNLDAGNTTQMTLSGLSNGVTYYFAIKSYEGNGVQSLFSAEISATISATNSPSAIRICLAMLPGKMIRLSGTGTIGKAYDVMATSDLKSWTVITNVTMNAQGTFSITNSATGSQRFYRLRGTLP